MNLRLQQTALAAFTALAAAVGAAVAATAEPDDTQRLAAALIAPAGNSTTVQVDVVDVDHTRGNELVLVAVEGGDEAARLERAALVRQQLAALGVAPQQVFIEGTAQE